MACLDLNYNFGTELVTLCLLVMSTDFTILDVYHTTQKPSQNRLWRHEALSMILHTIEIKTEANSSKIYTIANEQNRPNLVGRLDSSPPGHTSGNP
eukprot:942438-Pleurochrysis_carterae.AAC.1